jgi:hypothetical protein
MSNLMGKTAKIDRNDLKYPGIPLLRGPFRSKSKSGLFSAFFLRQSPEQSPPTLLAYSGKRGNLTGSR